MTDNADFPIVFKFEDLSVRTVDLNGEAWFVAADISDALDYRMAPDMTRNLDDDEKGTHIVRTLRGSQEMTIINESGLYSAILASRKPEAKRFKKWVTSEVLPAIRKTGSYNQPQQVPRFASLSRTSLSLIKSLKKETSAAARRVIHEQLALTCRMMGIQPPELGEIGSVEPEVPPAVDDFWSAYDALTTGPDAVRLNNSIDPSLIAVNLYQCCRVATEKKLAMPARRELMSSLKLSRNPLFLESNKNVRNSDDRTMRCWVFQVADDE